jgi:hypothetical protein
MITSDRSRIRSHTTYRTARTRILISKSDLICDYESRLKKGGKKELLHLGLEANAHYFAAYQYFQEKTNRSALFSSQEKDLIMYALNSQNGYDVRELAQNISRVQEGTLLASGNREIENQIKKVAQYHKLLRLNRIKGVSLQKETDQTIVDSAKELKLIGGKIRKYCLSDLKRASIQEIQKLAFYEVVQMVNDSKDYKQSLGAVSFLETCILLYYPFLTSLKAVRKAPSVFARLRRDCDMQYNTLCHFCGERIFLVGMSHFCPEKNPNSCYRIRMDQKVDLACIDSLILSRKPCEDCEKTPSKFIRSVRINNTRVRKFFCSKRCYEKWRKREYRKKKLTLVENSS